MKKTYISTSAENFIGVTQGKLYPVYKDFGGNMWFRDDAGDENYIGILTNRTLHELTDAQYAAMEIERLQKIIDAAKKNEEYEQYRDALAKAYSVFPGMVPETPLSSEDVSYIKFALKFNDANDGWIEWHGGENPVPGKAVQTIMTGETKDKFDPCRTLSDDLIWSHFGKFSDIIFYRVLN